LGGSLVDGIIGAAVTIPAMFASGYWYRVMDEKVGFLESQLWTFYGFGVFLVLHGYTLHTRGQTLGKVLLRMQIVTRIGLRVSPLPRLFALRYLPMSLAVTIPIFGQFLALIDVLFIFGAEKRCLHDVMAGTIVIRYRDDEEAYETAGDGELDDGPSPRLGDAG
jgi:uncharacterized RDD family membrane protein YckC